MAVTVVTPPTAEPVVLAEAKNWAKIDISDDDPLLATLITAAVESAEQYTRRSFINRTLKLTLDLPCYGWDRGWTPGVYDLPVNAFSSELPNTISLPLPPLVSISSVVTNDIDNASSTYSSSNYFVDTANSRLVLNSSAYWPSNLRPQAACEITYVAGYGATSSSVPMPIKTAILMHVQAMYDSRLICEMPEPCMRLLNQYRIYGSSVR